MKLTKEQQEIVNTKVDNLMVINAFAGTGKTSTLVEFVNTKSKEENASFLYISFNQSIKKEAESKFNKNVTVKTAHGLAFPILFKKFKNTQRLGNLYVNTIKSLSYLKYEKRFISAYAMATIKLFRKWLQSDRRDIEDFLESFKASKSFDYFMMNDATIQTTKRFGDIEKVIDKELDYKKIFHNVKALWNDYENDISKLPVEHDIYLKMFHLSDPVLRYDYILVDEAQDLSPVIIDMVLSQKTKKIFVGDKYQQIYSWRGAKNAIQFVQRKENVITKFLTTSFRCPTHVAKLANRYLKLNGETKDFVGLKEVENDFDVNDKFTYIARTNTHLAEKISEMLESHKITTDKKIYIIGGLQGLDLDFLLDLEYLSKNKPEKVTDSFLRNFKDYQQLMVYMKEAKDKSLEMSLKRIQKFKESYGSIYNMIQVINMVMTKNQKEAYYIFTTAHKSKGLEWDNVYIGSDFKDLIEFDKDGNVINIKQGEEMNLIYVAITRSKKNIYVPIVVDIDDEKYEKCLDYLRKMN